MTWQSDESQRPVPCLGLIAAFAFAFAFAGSGMAAAQQTVYVGGSGKSPVEINLGVIDTLLAPSRGPLVLDPPGQAPRSAFLLGTPVASAAASLARPLAAPAATAAPLAAPEPKPMVAALPKSTVTLPKTIAAPQPAPTLLEPLAMPQPAPLPPVTAEPLPEPPPEPIAAPQPSTAATPSLAPPEPVAEPAAAPIPEPAAAVAALAPEAAQPPSETLSIPFAGGSAELPDGAESELQAIAVRLAASDALRAQVKAYAESSTGSASSARRLSLSRALAVRSILIELGVRSTRIDVRALGDRNQGGAPDRVDVLVINR